MIENDLMQSLGMPNRNHLESTREKEMEEPRKDPPPIPMAENGFNGTMPPLQPGSLPGSLSLVALNLENALMPFKQLYKRKEQAREEDRENLRLLAASRADPNPMASDIRAITEANMAQAGMMPLHSSMPSSFFGDASARRVMNMAQSMDASWMPRGDSSANANTHSSSSSSEMYSRVLDALDVASNTTVHPHPNGGVMTAGNSFLSGGQFGTMPMFTDDDLPPPPPYTPVQPRDGIGPSAPPPSIVPTSAAAAAAVESQVKGKVRVPPAASNVQTAPAAQASAAEQALQAQLQSLETAARAKSSAIDASIDELKHPSMLDSSSIFHPPMPLTAASAAALPQSLASAAYHISERLDIAMFSITRRLRNQQAEDARMDNTVTPSFLSQESDRDLANITLTAMQAEAEATLQMKQRIEQNTARNAFARANVMSSHAHSYDDMAYNALRRQQMQTMDAERHLRAAELANSKVSAANHRVRQAEQNARMLEEQDRMLASTVNDITRDVPWLMEDYDKEFTDVVPFQQERPKKTTMMAATKDEEDGASKGSENKTEDDDKNMMEKKNVREKGASAPLSGEEAATAVVEATAPMAEEISAPVVIDESMPLVERAKILFEKRAVGDCVGGLDAEVVLRQLGAECVEGSAAVSLVFFCGVKKQCKDLPPQ